MYKSDLISCARILEKHRLCSGPFGNISIRIPDSNQYWINPNGIPFEGLTESDLILVDLKEATEQEHLNLPIKTHPGDYIHRAIYHHRPDVNAIVHTHSHSTVMFSLFGIPVGAYTQIGAAFQRDQGIYSGFNGPVRDQEEGNKIATALGKNSVVIAKNHGVFTTAPSLSAALWDMILFDWAAREHLHAVQLGIKEAPPFLGRFAKKVEKKSAGKCMSLFGKTK